ncbi:MAG TPA: COX15/CtaA family protein [Candidatus Megaira endosymbiont of Nemacystus decipiens]|nr:COX15/CtaA family protein [Candidatus Megaera endosymbiont of Nemacystus decipiens]
MTKNSRSYQQSIIAWLSVLCTLIVLMVLIGGFTRLTDSGLSITEWNPISGVLVPITEDSWQIEFEKYKQSPEFININYAMSLSEFKSIYIIEFIHRIAARVTGIVLIVPFLYFLLQGAFKPRDIFIYLGAIVLLLLQGFVGWYMVKSGLVLDPHVSHFRLALHLILAVILYLLLLWQIFKNTNQFILLSTQKSPISSLFWGKISIIFILIQIMLGAFVAGLKGGLIYNDFPLMGKKFIPYELLHIKFGWHLLSDPVLAQFLHRVMAYILTIIIVIYAVKLVKLGSLKLTKSAILLLSALAIQISSGIFTLTHAVPITAALIHQLGSVLLISCIMWSYYLLTTNKSNV